MVEEYTIRIVYYKQAKAKLPIGLYLNEPKLRFLNKLRHIRPSCSLASLSKSFQICITAFASFVYAMGSTLSLCGRPNHRFHLPTLTPVSQPSPTPNTHFFQFGYKVACFRHNGTVPFNARQSVPLRKAEQFTQQLLVFLFDKAALDPQSRVGKVLSHVVLDFFPPHPLLSLVEKFFNPFSS